MSQTDKINVDEVNAAQWRASNLASNVGDRNFFGDSREVFQVPNGVNAELPSVVINVNGGGQVEVGGWGGAAPQVESAGWNGAAPQVESAGWNGAAPQVESAGWNGAAPQVESAGWGGTVAAGWNGTTESAGWGGTVAAGWNGTTEAAGWGGGVAAAGGGAWGGGMSAELGQQAWASASQQDKSLATAMEEALTSGNFAEAYKSLGPQFDNLNPQDKLTTIAIINSFMQANGLGTAWDDMKDIKNNNDKLWLNFTGKGNAMANGGAGGAQEAAGWGGAISANWNGGTESAGWGGAVSANWNGATEAAGWGGAPPSVVSAGWNGATEAAGWGGAPPSVVSAGWNGATEAAGWGGGVAAAGGGGAWGGGMSAELGQQAWASASQQDKSLATAMEEALTSGNFADAYKSLGPQFDNLNPQDKLTTIAIINSFMQANGLGTAWDDMNDIKNNNDKLWLNFTGKGNAMANGGAGVAQEAAGWGGTVAANWGGTVAANWGGSTEAAGWGGAPPSVVAANWNGATEDGNWNGAVNTGGGGGSAW